MRGTAVAALALAGVAVLAGCGGGSNAADSSTPSPTATATLQDRQAAEACNLVAKATPWQGLDSQQDYMDAEKYATEAEVDPKYDGLSTAIADLDQAAIRTIAGGNPGILNGAVVKVHTICDQVPAGA